MTRKEAPRVYALLLLCFVLAISVATSGTIIVEEGHSADNGFWHDLWIMNLDRSCKRQITNDLADDFEPTVSPDGRYIAWRSNREASGLGIASNFNIFVMDIHAYNYRQLTTNSADDGTPVWSLNGDFVYFQSDRNNDGLREWYRIQWTNGVPGATSATARPAAWWAEPTVQGAKLIRLDGNDTSKFDIGVRISRTQSAYIYISGVACMAGGTENPTDCNPGLFSPYLTLSTGGTCRYLLSQRETHVAYGTLTEYFQGCWAGDSARLHVGLVDRNPTDNTGWYAITIIPNPVP